MKLNRTFVVLMAVVCALMLAGEAFALNRVEVKVESQGLPEGSTCAKAGGFSFEWDSGSVITVGDTVEIDLEYVNAANLMTLCRNIDILLAVNNTPMGWTNGTEGTVPTTSTGTAIYQIQNTVGTNAFAIANAPTAGIYFHIYGQAGTNGLTLVVLGDAGATITVAGGSNDAFGIKFLDQRVINIFHDDANNGLAADTTYTGATVLQNTLCVNVSLWDVATTAKSTFNANIDAVADQWTFIPSNPQIAHISQPVQPNQYRIVGCKENVGTISVQQVQQSVCTFDYETELGYNPDATGDHRVIVESMNQAWDPNYDYTVTLEIMVRPSGSATYMSGDNGVYWTAQNIGFITAADTDTHCNDLDDMADNAPVASNCQAGTNCAAVGTCSETNHSRIIQAVNINGVANVGANHRFLWIDFPTLAYNSSTAGTMVENGDAVQVRVTIGASNPNTNVCGADTFTLGPYDIPVGAFGPAGQNFSLVYPYFVEATAANWWAGLAIVNMSDAAGDATVYIYEEDGDQAAVTVNVGANDMYVNLTSGLFAEPGLVATPGGATIGDARAYMIVCSAFNIDGFAMVGNNETGEGQGYLPRQPAAAPGVCNP
jgi:hypothetical protein